MFLNSLRRVRLGRAGSLALTVGLLLTAADRPSSLLARQRTAPEATGSIGGVVRDESGRGIGFAQVTLSSDRTRREAVADRSGTFAFKGLAAGSYLLSASAPGFFDAVSLPQGLIDSFDAGRIVLEPGESIDDIEVVLQRPEAIAGRVVDTAGWPVVGASVAALRSVYVDGRRVPAFAQTARTDDRGAFRLAGLPLGDYRVWIDGSDVIAPSEAGRRRVYGSGLCGPPAADREVHLDPGSQPADLSCVLSPVATAAVAGAILPPPAAPAGGLTIRLSPAETAGVGLSAAIRTTVTGADGTFAFENVSTGEYVLDVDTSAHDAAAAIAPGVSGPSAFQRPRGPSVVTTPAPGLRLYHPVIDAGSAAFVGHQEISVGPEGLRDIRIGLVPTLTIEGRVVIVGPPQAPPPGFDEPGTPDLRSTIRLVAEPAGVASSPLDDEGRFRIAGLPPQVQRIRLASPSRFAITRMTVGGRVLDAGEGIDLSTGPPAGEVRVEVGGEGVTIEGAVGGRDGARGCVVVLFTPQSDASVAPRAITAVVPDRRGQYQLRFLDGLPIPAGTYALLAVPIHAARAYRLGSALSLQARGAAVELRATWGETHREDLACEDVPLQ